MKLLIRLFELRDSKSTSMAPDLRLQSTRVYIDDTHAPREISALFRDGPLIAGLSAELPDAGDYFTVELGQVSVVVVRSENAGVRAFLNACPQRGSRRGAARRTGCSAVHDTPPTRPVADRRSVLLSM